MTNTQGPVGRTRRFAAALAASTLAVAALIVSPPAALAQGDRADSKATADAATKDAGTKGAGAKDTTATPVPEPPSREAVRELVSRLSDEEARRLLITQLDRAAPAEAAGAQAPRAVVTAIDNDTERIRANVQAIAASIPALPRLLGAGYDRYLQGRERSHGTLVLMLFAGAVGLGALVEWAFRRRTRSTRARLEEDRTEGLGAQTVRLGLRLALELAALGVFAAGVVAVYLTLYAGHAPSRFVVLTALVAVLGRAAGLDRRAPVACASRA